MRLSLHSVSSIHNVLYRNRAHFASTNSPGLSAFRSDLSVFRSDLSVFRSRLRRSVPLVWVRSNICCRGGCPHPPAGEQCSPLRCRRKCVQGFGRKEPLACFRKRGVLISTHSKIYTFIVRRPNCTHSAMVSIYKSHTIWFFIAAPPVSPATA